MGLGEKYLQVQECAKATFYAELDTLRRSRNPTVVVTANGEVQTSEEAQVTLTV